MKRFFVTLILVLLVVWAVRSSHQRPVIQAPSPTMPWPAPRHPHSGPAGGQFAEARHQTQRALAKAGRVLEDARQEIQKVSQEARQEIRHVWNEAKDEIRQAYHEALAADGGPRPPMPPPPPPAPTLVRENAEGLPVPIVPGTRVTTAEARPPAPKVPARVISRSPQASTRRNPPNGAAPEPAHPGATIVNGQVVTTDQWRAGLRSMPTPSTIVEGQICADRGACPDRCGPSASAAGQRVAPS